MREIFKAWLKDEQGATGVEYGILVGGVALAIMVAVFAMGGDISSIFEAVNSLVTQALARISI